MWKIAQPQPNRKPKNAPKIEVDASIHSSRKMISPAYMFPNSRSECDSGLEMYSMHWNAKFAAMASGIRTQDSGLSESFGAPNGAKNSSWIQPPRPLALI